MYFLLFIYTYYIVTLITYNLNKLPTWTIYFVRFEYVYLSTYIMLKQINHILKSVIGT